MPVEWGYALILIFASLVSLRVSYAAWRRLNSPGSFPLVALMLALAFWSLSYSFHWLRVPQPRELFWVDVTYLGVVTVPIAFLAFALQFTGRGHWLTRTRYYLLLIVPILTLVLLWTDPAHGFFFGDVARSPENPTILEGGIWFYVYVAFSYSLIFVGLFFLVQSYLSAESLYRRQVQAILIGAFFPLATNLISLLGLSPFPNLDLTPLAFTLTGVFFSYSMYRLGLLDILPIARHTVVDEMSDGMVVLDNQYRVVDINPAARQLMGIEERRVIGKPAHDLFTQLPILEEHIRSTLDVQEELRLPGDPSRTIDLRITALRAGSGALRGRLIILRDITERVRMEEEIRQANQRLQRQLAEIEGLQGKLQEQAIRDPLTRLFNRRYLEESLASEIAKARRSRQPLSVAMIDIDGFKSFNDMHGHAGGDQMLQNLAEILVNSSREGDVICRFGGEEFVIVIPGATREVAERRMESIRHTFERQSILHDGKRLSSTLSGGVASFPDDGSTRAHLLDAADQAMYRAKEAGRNRIFAATS